MRALFLLSAALLTGWDAAQQAQRGRDAWREAVTALRGGDSATALSKALAAHAAWPGQPAYAEGAARLAARRGDDTNLTALLRRLAAQEVGGSLASDSVVLRRANATGDVRDALVALRAATAARERSRARVVHPDTMFFAEGLARDATDGTLYVSSLHHRNVLVLRGDGTTRWLLGADAPPHGGVFGIALAPDATHLWITLAPVAQAGEAAGDTTRRAELWQIRLRDGQAVQRLALGDGSGMPGEIAVMPDGTVLVSDGLRGLLYRLRPSGAAVETVRSPQLRSPQGIAPRGDGTAIVADWSHGLLRWDLRSDSIVAVEVTAEMALLGIDGLVADGDAVLGVQNGAQPMRIVRARLAADGRRVLAVETVDRPAQPEGELTALVRTRDSVHYVSSSAWPFWTERGTRVPGSGALPPVTLRRLALPR